MSIAIRELGIADKLLLEELLDTTCPGWSDEQAPGASGAIAFLSQPRTFAFGAYVDNDPAGWLWGAQSFHPNGRRTSRIHELIVVKEHLRKGIASALLDAAAGLARTEGSDQIQLAVEDGNVAANALFARIGWSHDGSTVQTHSRNL